MPAPGLYKSSSPAPQCTTQEGAGTARAEQEPVVSARLKLRVLPTGRRLAVPKSGDICRLLS
jgi:hypothetical protein